MFKMFVIILGSLLATSNAGLFTSRLLPLDGRIIGGEDAKIKDYPYQVSLRQSGSHICGGSILDTGDKKTTGLYVVTAGHCVESKQQLSIQYGITALGSATDKVISVARILRHEEYNANTIDYDIALLELQEPIPFSKLAQPIPIAKSTPPVGAGAVVTGWGSVKQGGSLSRKLQQVTVEISDHSKCIEQYAEFNSVTPRMLCAGVPEGGKDACQGDSGGPLVVDNELVGIVSWGVSCALPNYPGVYSNAAEMRSWVEYAVPFMPELI